MSAVLRRLPEPIERIERAVRRAWRATHAADRDAAIAAVNAGRLGLYFGGLAPDKPQYASQFIGLALHPGNDREILHDARAPLPFADGVAGRIQSEDVFEHIPFDTVQPILDEVFRVLAPGGVFRLSLPDYRCPALRARCVFDCEGRIIADLTMGGSATLDAEGRAAGRFTDDGDAHVWFPTIETTRLLIERSNIRNCRDVAFRHYTAEDGSSVVRDYPDLDMPVMRAPPVDMRAGGAPVSIIVDFTK